MADFGVIGIIPHIFKNATISNQMPINLKTLIYIACDIILFSHICIAHDFFVSDTSKVK